MNKKGFELGKGPSLVLVLVIVGVVILMGVWVLKREPQLCIQACIEESCKPPLHNIECDTGNWTKDRCTQECLTMANSFGVI